MINGLEVDDAKSVQQQAISQEKRVVDSIWIPNKW